MSFDQPSTPDQQPGVNLLPEQPSQPDPPAQPASAPNEPTSAPEQTPDGGAAPADQLQPPAEPGGQPLTEAGQALQAEQDKADVQGYRGENPDPRPNSDYSLESGPESPTVLQQLRDAAQAEVDRLDALLAEAQGPTTQGEVS